jgi:hypothetical protein
MDRIPQQRKDEANDLFPHRLTFFSTTIDDTRGSNLSMLCTYIRVTMEM